MAHGGPDWVESVLVNVLVDNAPVPATPTSEAPAGAVGTYAGTAQSYQTVASWTVTTGKVGVLVEILILSSNYAKTKVKIEIGSTVYANNWAPQGAMPIIFENLPLAAGTVIKVSGESSDGTSVTIDAAIVGREVG